MKFELNEVEKKMLEEIKNGKSEILFDKKKETNSKDEIHASFFLVNLGFAEGERYSDENKIGYINLKITDKGKYAFMNEKEIKDYVSGEIEKLFED